jgi:hypothetical protein
MKQGLLFIMMCFAINGYSQTEFSSKFKAIPRWIQVLKLKSNSCNSCATRYCRSNILKKVRVKFQINFKMVILILFL